MIADQRVPFGGVAFDLRRSNPPKIATHVDRQRGRSIRLMFRGFRGNLLRHQHDTVAVNTVSARAKPIRRVWERMKASYANWEDGVTGPRSRGVKHQGLTLKP